LVFAPASLFLTNYHLPLIGALYAKGELRVKSKIVFSIYILLVFIFGLGSGLYLGFSVGISPQVYQLWAGANEMQAAISYIDRQENNKARALLCNSIKTRVEIINQVQLVQTDVMSHQVQELEKYVYDNLEVDKEELKVTCI